MKQNPRLTNREVILLSGEIQSLRAAVSAGKSLPELDTWIEEITPKFGRVITESQVMAVVYDCGLRKPDLFARDKTTDRNRSHGPGIKAKLNSLERKIDHLSDELRKALVLLELINTTPTHHTQDSA